MTMRALAFGALLLVAPVLMTPGFGLWQAGAALAQEEGEEAQRKTRKTPAMREKVYKKLSEAQVLAEAGNLDESIPVLEELRRMKDLNSYEVAQLWTFYGFVYFSQENYPQAIKAYETVLAQENLPEAMETSTLYSLSQLYFVAEDYKRALGALDRWFAVAINPGPQPFIMRAQALYQLERYKEAIEPVETAIEIANRQNKPIKENWLLLLRVFHYELNDYPKVIEILEQLVKMFPKKEYWTQLSGMYGELEQPRKQLYAYEAAYLQGALNRGREVVTLAQLYLQVEAPYLAAKVLEKGFADGLVEKSERNYRLLSQAWTLAAEDEKAIPALIAAAKLSDDGELDVRLASSFLNLDQFAEAVSAARDGIAKGGLKRPDTANLVLGMALYNMEKYEQAKNAFRVAQDDKRSAKVARQWINHIVSEQARLEELRLALQ